MSPARKLRLLSIGHSYCVTFNRQMLNEMARLGRNRWEVTVVAPDLFPGDLGTIRCAVQPDEIVAVRSVPVHFAEQIHLMLYARQLKGLLKNSWDLVHYWEEPYILPAAQVTWWTPRSIPLVISTFQNISKRYPPPFGLVEKYCLSRCSGWVTAGKEAERTLLGRGYYTRPHRVIPFFVDQTVFRPEPQLRSRTLSSLGWKEDIPVVGYLGRFEVEKGIKVLAAALAATKAPWRLLLVGGGRLDRWLKDWALPYGDRVRVIDSIPHEQVPAYLNAMDILCAPSQTTPAWREQFGRMIIEAFACGVPVVGSDSGEIPNVVADAGVIVPADDPIAWARAIDDLLNAQNLRKEFACRGFQRVSEHFSLEVIANQHLAFFDEILEMHKSSNRARA